jgi:pseudaminic acid cytidylyltransferase
MNVIAVIPARGGSKRIARKNIRDFAGVSMLARTIISARESELFTNILVTTEDSEISDIAVANGAKTIKRPDNLGDDYATTLEVISHSCTEILEKNQLQKTIVCCIYPATPLLNYLRVKQAIRILLEGNCDFVFPVKKMEYAPQRSFKIQGSGRLQLTEDGAIKSRTQDLEPTYYDAGQFYVGLASSWLSNESLISNNAIGLLLGKYEVIDIDDNEDWAYAQELFSIRNKLTNYQSEPIKFS